MCKVCKGGGRMGRKEGGEVGETDKARDERGEVKERGRRQVKGKEELKEGEEKGIRVMVEPKEQKKGRRKER